MKKQNNPFMIWNPPKKTVKLNPIYSPKKTKSSSMFNFKPAIFSNKTNLSPFTSIPKKSLKKVSKNQMDWFQAKRKYPKLNPFTDADRDGVPNIIDCKPFNKKKHGITLQSIAKAVTAPIITATQKVAQVATQAYKAADVAVGGYLPGGVPIASKKITTSNPAAEAQKKAQTEKAIQEAIERNQPEKKPPIIIEYSKSSSPPPTSSPPIAVKVPVITAKVSPTSPAVSTGIGILAKVSPTSPAVSTGIEIPNPFKVNIFDMPKREETNAAYLELYKKIFGPPTILAGGIGGGGGGGRVSMSPSTPITTTNIIVPQKVVVPMSSYKGIPYSQSKTMAVEAETGRIARDYRLNTQNAKLEDHYFIKDTTGKWIDVGIFNPNYKK